MDRRISFFFYQIVNNRHSAANLPECVRQIAEIPPGLKREIALDPNFIVRLERLEEAHGLIIGEMLRKQIINFPARVPLDGLAEPLGLGDDSLGHNSVFIFKPQDGLLVYERNRNGVSINRFLQYLRAKTRDVNFTSQPILTTNSLKMLTDNNPTRLSIKISDPENLQVFEKDELSPLQNLGKVKALTGGAYINVEFGIGREKIELNKGNIISIVKNMLYNRDKDTGGVKGIKANIKIEDSGQVTPLDFINAHLQHSEEIRLPEDDPEERFNVKVNAARRGLDSKYDEYTLQKSLQ